MLKQTITKMDGSFFKLTGLELKGTKTKFDVYLLSDIGSDLLWDHNEQKDYIPKK